MQQDITTVEFYLAKSFQVPSINRVAQCWCADSSGAEVLKFFRHVALPCRHGGLRVGASSTLGAHRSAPYPFAPEQVEADIAQMSAGSTNKCIALAAAFADLVPEWAGHGRRHFSMLMRWMGIEAIYRRPRMLEPAPGHTILAYVLRKLTVARHLQVWGTEVIYIPEARTLSILPTLSTGSVMLAWKLSPAAHSQGC